MTRRDNDDIANALIAALMGVAIGAFVLCCLFSCRSQQITNNEQHRDSVAVHHRYDTTFITITDTIHIDTQQTQTTDEGATIIFVPDGGQYNTQTGQATGVKQVKQSKQSNTQMEQSVVIQSRVERLQHTTDSLRQVLKTYKIASERKTNTSDIKPQRSSYDRFCSAFFWIVLIAGLLALVWWWTERRFGWWTILKALLKL